MINRLHIAALLAGLMAAGTVTAQDCEVNISANDQIEYSESEVRVSADCDEVTLTLEHNGELQVEQMGHNWVLAESDVWESVAQDGMAAGLENDHVPADDDRVIAHTEMIGGGESTSITFDVSGLDADADYTFFCSFPGHWAVMNGDFILES